MKISNIVHHSYNKTVSRDVTSRWSNRTLFMNNKISLSLVVLLILIVGINIALHTQNATVKEVSKDFILHGKNPAIIFSRMWQRMDAVPVHPTLG